MKLFQNYFTGWLRVAKWLQEPRQQCAEPLDLKGCSPRSLQAVMHLHLTTHRAGIFTGLNGMFHPNNGSLVKYLLNGTLMYHASLPSKLMHLSLVSLPFSFSPSLPSFLFPSFVPFLIPSFLAILTWLLLEDSLPEIIQLYLLPYLDFQSSFLSMCFLIRKKTTQTPKPFKMETAPNLRWFDFWFFDFTMVWKRYVFSRNHTSNFDLPGLAICSTILSRDAGQQQWASAPSQSQDHKGKQPVHVQPFSSHTTILFFTFNTVFSKLHEIFNTFL